MQPITIKPGVVHQKDVDSVLYLIQRDIAERGISQQELRDWATNNCPFPHLRFRDEIMQLAPMVLDALGLEEYEAGKLCEPQIVWHWPDPLAKERNQWPHIDSLPPWANGRPYSRIVGLALTRWNETNGTLCYWKPGQVEPNQKPNVWARDIIMSAGDIVVMRPDVPHTAGVNFSPNVRAGIYFRWLRPVDMPL